MKLIGSQHSAFHDVLYEHMGVSHADPLDKGAGGAASKFEIRIQHPCSYAVIEKIISDLEVKYGLATPPKIRAVEVSIDFYHDSADYLALKEMTERLMFSIVPYEISNPRMHDLSGGMLPASRFVDPTKTLYIGNKCDDVMWRIYLKRTDESFLGEDGIRVVKHLPNSEFRARVEVQLQGNALKQIGLETAKGLLQFSFERLHSAGLFKFAIRDVTSGLLAPNIYAEVGLKSLGIDDESPAFALNGFGRRDRRGRWKQLSRHLITDTELTEASRNSLRGLTKRFTQKHLVL